MNRKDASNRFSLLLMMAFFIMSFLLLVLFGTKIYQNIYRKRQESDRLRTLASYLHTAAKNNEARIYTRNMEGKNVLVIEDESGRFGNRIYLHDGYLVEDAGLLNDELNEESAVRIAESGIFEIEPIGDDLLKITTSDRVVYISLFTGVQR